MTIAFWIVASLAALIFIVAGAVKLVRPLPALEEAGMGWVADFSPLSVRLVALAEVVGGVGLVLPPLSGFAVLLSPVAGVCLAILMGGAIVVHLRRSEPPALVIVLTLLPIAAAVLGAIAIV